MEKAKELGYTLADVDTAEPEDEEEDESVQEAFAPLEAALIPLLVESKVFCETAMWQEAYDKAKAAGDVEKAYQAAAIIAESAGVPLDFTPKQLEEMKTKAARKGRKPSGKTLRRKATRKSPPKPKPPVNTGPGAAGNGEASGPSLRRAVEGQYNEPTAFVYVSVTFPKAQLKEKAAIQKALTALADDYGGEPDQTSTGGGQFSLTYRFNAESTLQAGNFASAVKEGRFKKKNPLFKDATVEFDPEDVVQAGDESAHTLWLEEIRRMDVQEFHEHMQQCSLSDLPEQFKARVEAMKEAYVNGPGRKDIARKVTEANPIIKRKLGKGLSLEGILKEDTQSQPSSRRILFPAGRLDEFLKIATEAGADGTAQVEMEADVVAVTLPRPIAEKVTLLFTGQDVAVEDVKLPQQQA